MSESSLFAIVAALAASNLLSTHPISKFHHENSAQNTSTLDHQPYKCIANLKKSRITNTFPVSSVNGSRKTINGDLCITYQDVDQIVKQAIGNMGGFIPKEIRDLSSNSPRPHHVGVIAGILEEATKIMASTYGLSVENIHFDLRTIDLSQTILSQICPTFLTKVRCEVSKYRTLSGMCNNLKNPSWGSARSAMVRYLTPVYEDGISEPRSQSVSGKLLPNPRLVSQATHSDESLTDHGITTMIATWGQIIVHDINFGSPTFDEHG